MRAVNRTTGRGVHEALDAGQDGVLEQAQRTHSIDLQVLLGMIEAVLVGEKCGQMEDDRGLVEEDALHLDLVEDVALRKQNVRDRRHVPPLRAREIVENDYLGACFGERARQVAANGSGTAGHQHGFIFVELSVIHKKL